MEDMILAIKNKDLVEVKKLFTEGMKEKIGKLIKSERLSLCQNIVIEGEEKEETDIEDDKVEDEDNKDNKDDKDDKVEDEDNKDNKDK